MTELEEMIGGRWFTEEQQGEVIPDGYGYAYMEYDRNVIVFHRIPINVIVRWLRRLYLWLKAGSWKARSAEWEAYRAGYAARDNERSYLDRPALPYCQ